MGGDFSNWDAGYRLALGNELTENRPWLGTLYWVAIFRTPGPRPRWPPDIKQGNRRQGAILFDPDEGTGGLLVLVFGGDPIRAQKPVRAGEVRLPTRPSCGHRRRFRWCQW